MADEQDACGSCGEGLDGDCPKSKRPCGHHCNHVWTHDACDWCGAEFGPPICGVADADTGERCYLVEEDHGRGHVWQVRSAPEGERS